jgi:tetratricopeptide (TPR) repeat protein
VTAEFKRIRRPDVYDSHLDFDWGDQRGDLDIARALEDLADGNRAGCACVLHLIRTDLPLDGEAGRTAIHGDPETDPGGADPARHCAAGGDDAPDSLAGALEGADPPALEYRKGRKDKAREALDIAIRANKKQIMPYHVYAWMLAKDGDRDAAINKLVEAEKVEKGNESTQENLSRLRNGKKLNMKRFGMGWFGLQLEKPPAQYRAGQGMAGRKGFRQKPQRRR